MIRPLKWFLDRRRSRWFRAELARRRNERAAKRAEYKRRLASAPVYKGWQLIRVGRLMKRAVAVDDIRVISPRDFATIHGFMRFCDENPRAVAGQLD